MSTRRKASTLAKAKPAAPEAGTTEIVERKAAAEAKPAVKAKTAAKPKAPAKARAAAKADLRPVSSAGAAAPVAPNPRYRIFQIYYEPWHRDLLDPLFEPFDNIGTPSELLEFDIFERLAASTAITGAEYWGALSWRFTEKTGLSGADLVAAMEERPDVDVFFCNPHPHNEALYHNMWVQGETSHPRFLDVCRQLFAAVGLPSSEFELLMPSASYSAANYFVGRPAFWQRYLPFVRKLLTLAEQNMSPAARQLLHSRMADDQGLHGGSTYLPFIVERLLPLFLRTDGAGLKAQKLRLAAKEQELNIHLRMLRDMKDVAIQTRSPWLGACWVNYRALYMTQFNGREWCQKYLRAITPATVKFPGA